MEASSDEDLSEVTPKRHFLDYDAEPPTAVESKPSEINVIPSKNIVRPTAPESSCTKKASSSSSSVKVENVYSILSLLGSNSADDSDVTRKFLELSKNREMCVQMRLSGCISLLVQIIHSEPDNEARQKQCLQALHNIIHCSPDDKAGRREARVLKLIEQLLDYCDSLRAIMRNELSDDIDRYPIQAIGTLMKISFDEEHRYAMCQLGALQTISKLIQLDHEVHGSSVTSSSCVTRRYAGMCLTNLTFGDGNNKALLCSNKKFMQALVDQINSNADDLVQVTASVVRNLSWRADATMKEVLSETGAVRTLTMAAMTCTPENTLKAILSALWNLSNHCAKNKAEFCEIEGAIEFLVDMLSYEAASKTTAVIENSGGILRNVSTHIALHEHLRVILRKRNCLCILLQQLKSPSLTVVSNACGTLGNLSAHSLEDQKFLRESGAIPMLRSLIYSKHKMISTGSTIALRHLLACKANASQVENMDSVVKMMDLKELPTLNVRKQRALENDLINTTECFKIDDTPSSLKDGKIKHLFESSEGEKNMPPSAQDPEDPEPEADVKLSEFQETNLDQITDYSIRYAENPYESEDEAVKPSVPCNDTIKSYNTEGTPHALLSESVSLTDLRISKESEKVSVPKTRKGKVSGNQSPEKTVNYCTEGTPGNFSRNDSLSDLEEGAIPNHKNRNSGLCKPTISAKETPGSLTPSLVRKDSVAEKDFAVATPKSVTFGVLALETPMMFSRTSSIGSLSSAEPICTDDRSSVVSDFSRLASGMISPSDLPDSPTQSIPASPSRRNFSHQPKTLGTRNVAEHETAEDSTNVFLVENTPAAHSYATSLSNLSFDDEPKISTDAITKDFQLMKHPSCEEEDQKLEIEAPISQQHSDTESDDEILLESCIRYGMNRATNTSKEIPFVPGSSSDVHVRGAKEGGTSRYPTQLVKEHPVDMMRSGAPLLPQYLQAVDEINQFIVEDSPCNFSLMSGLSAITIDSNKNVSQQCSATKPTVDLQNSGAGISAKTDSVQKEFDSLSSISVDSEDDGNLLIQAIACGANKPMKIEPSPSLPIDISYKPRPSAETCNESLSSVDSCGDGANLMLERCIQSGINRVVKKDSSKGRSHVSSSPKKIISPTIRNKLPNTDEINEDELLQECIADGVMKNTQSGNFGKSNLLDSKNGKSTSATLSSQCAYTVTGVEGTPKKSFAKKRHTRVSQDSPHKTNGNPDRNENIDSENERSHQANWTMPSGFSANFELNLSLGSFCEENILERSNEYPAARVSMSGFGEFDDDLGMENSNEFMMEMMSDSKMEDKHKDPNLMLKSVDRLTQELVSTAEYLRKNKLCDDISTEAQLSGSLSNNNTWNDENSFPTIGMTAPMIGSTNDEATFDYKLPVELLDDKTPTNENFAFGGTNDESEEPVPKIEFKVGGEIGRQTFGRLQFDSTEPSAVDSSSFMSTSTIVRIEAKKVATSIASRLTDSTDSLILENVRPPSSMEFVSLNCYQDLSSMHDSSFKKHPNSVTMTGIVAKRAIAQNFLASSLESVHNIDSIRPPSIMDELLDSMISVDSIISEIADPTTKAATKHDVTAFSDAEDSLTLQNCQELSKNDTLTSSDFSSAESSPKRRSLGSSQRRITNNDRYKTFTIQADKQEISTEKNARQKRQDDRKRFETQVIDLPTALKPTETPDQHFSANFDEAADDLSIQAMTENLTFLKNILKKDDNTVEPPQNKLKKIQLRTKLNIKSEHQSAETLVQSSQSSNETSHPKPKLPQPVGVKKVLSKKSYVSPYRMQNQSTAASKIAPKKSSTDAIREQEMRCKSEVASPTTPLIRQGTFVKDKPSLDNVPVLNETQSPKTPKTAPPSKLRQGDSTESKKKASNLPISLSHRSDITKLPAVPIRSKTGINLNNPKKNVCSKIAGIWKRADKGENASKQSPVVPGRIQIRKALSDSPINKMKRSSTLNEIA